MSEQLVLFLKEAGTGFNRQEGAMPESGVWG